MDHELYGFHRGYFVSPHHVAETIRNFVAYFFSCDVCRTNFLVRVWAICYDAMRFVSLSYELVIALNKSDNVR